jgi:AcrR family transcriptional regulator
MSSAPTPLARQVAGEPRRAAPVDALSLARRCFLRGQRVDMGNLATELRISRVTLYRWVGNREQFLAEVAWSLLQDTLHAETSKATGSGGDRVAQILSGLIENVVGNPGFQAFLNSEEDLALRLFATVDGGVQPRIVAAVTELLDTEIRAEALDLPVPSEELAFAIVRLLESFVYRRFLTGEEADPAHAAQILRMLLR